MDGQSYVEQVRGLKQMLMTLPPAGKEEQDKLWKRFRLEWNYNSMHSAADAMPYTDVEQFVSLDKTVIASLDARYETLKAHNSAINMVADESRAKSKPLSGDFIHRVMEKLGIALPKGENLEKLLNWYNGQKDLDPVALAASFYYRLLVLSASYDKSGRIALLMMNYILLKNDLPPVILKIEDKEDYDIGVKQISKGDANAFIEYIASQLLASLDLSIRYLSVRKKDDSDAWKRKLESLKQILPE